MGHSDVTSCNGLTSRFTNRPPAIRHIHVEIPSINYPYGGIWIVAYGETDVRMDFCPQLGYPKFTSHPEYRQFWSNFGDFSVFLQAITASHPWWKAKVHLVVLSVHRPWLKLMDINGVDSFLVHCLSRWLTFSYFLITSRWNTLLGSRYTVVIPRLVRRPSAQRKAPFCGPVKHLGHTKLWVPPQHFYLCGTISQGIFCPLPLLPFLDHYARSCYHYRDHLNAIVNIYGGFVINFWCV